MIEIYRLMASTGHALAWTEIYGAAAIGIFIVFTGVAMSVALFTRNSGRARRAHEIFTELLNFLRWRGR